MERYNSSRTASKRDLPVFMSVILFLLVMGTAVAIFFIKDFSLIFLGVYALILILILVCNTKIPRQLGGVFRTLVGALFLFSGFVKAVDPIGFQYKFIDYLEAYHLMWLEPISLVLVILASALEFVTGFMLFFDIKHKIAIPIATLMMAGFTLLTLNDAINNMVPDCGCFGEAVKLSNWQTFYKNLTIDLALVIVWFTYSRMKPFVYSGTEIGSIIVVSLLIIGFQIYCLVYLPVVDFRDWKVGKKMTLDDPLPIEYWVDYSNDSTGEIVSMLSKDIPYGDSVWMSHWNYVNTRTIDKNVYTHNVMLFDESGSNVTANILANPNPHIFIVSYALSDIKMKHFDEIKDIISYCDSHNYDVEFITSSEWEEIEKFAEENALDVMFYNADDTELKSMIRSNPGVLAMKNGYVLKKWSRNNLPDSEELDELFN